VLSFGILFSSWSNLTPSGKKNSIFLFMIFLHKKSKEKIGKEKILKIVGWCWWLNEIYYPDVVLSYFIYIFIFYRRWQRHQRHFSEGHRVYFVGYLLCYDFVMFFFLYFVIFYTILSALCYIYIFLVVGFC